MGIVMIAALLLSAGIIPAASNQPQTAISNPSTLTSSSPDLVIIDIWNEGSTIYYEIKNIGTAAAPGSYSRLYIDGRSKRSDSVKSLAPEESSTESFSYRWICTSSEDTIKVCADHIKQIAECDESNNCRTETWPC